MLDRGRSPSSPRERPRRSHSGLSFNNLHLEPSSFKQPAHLFKEEHLEDSEALPLTKYFRRRRQYGNLRQGSARGPQAAGPSLAGRFRTLSDCANRALGMAPDCLYEIKHDGYRALAFKEGKDVRLVSRNKKAFDFCGSLGNQFRLEGLVA